MLGKPLKLSVKIVVRDDAGRCLLLRRSLSSKGNPGKWDFPGGKIDPGESFDEALVRRNEARRLRDAGLRKGGRPPWLMTSS